MNGESEIEHVEEQVSYLIERGRYDQARTLIGNALRSDPTNTTLLISSAYIYREEENYDDAETVLEEVLSLDPDNERARFLLANVYKDKKRYAEAERLTIELIRYNPDSSIFYAFYAKIMLETLHIEKADKLARRAIQLDPDDIYALCVSVICDVIRSNKAQYQQRLSELVRNYPETQATAAMISFILFDQKKHREALRIARELLRSDPTDEDLVEVIKELRVATHPTMIPLWPAIKFGWHASVVLWISAIIFFSLSSRYLPNAVTGIIACVWLFYVLYSWIYPPILRKIFKYLEKG